MTPEDKFSVGMTFSYCKEGSEDDAWVLTNTYNGMDYAQLVLLQKVLVEKLGTLLTDMGIAQAEALGFDMVSLASQFGQKEKNAKPGTFGSPGASPKR